MRHTDSRFLPRCKCGRLCPVGKRKCAKCVKVRKVTKGRDSNRGRNKVGIAAHKPDKSHTRKAKRQNTASLGMQPRDLQAVNMRDWV